MRRRDIRIEKISYVFVVPIYFKDDDVINSNMVGREKMKILNSQENNNMVKTKYQL